jgi:hypothetical protein
MIYSTQLTTTGDTLVYTSTTTGDPIGAGVSGQTNAVTCIIVCNTGTPDNANETVNSSLLTLNLCSIASGGVSTNTNTIVKNLIVPAGETVFFSDERIVLSPGDRIRATASAANLLSITVSSLPV